MYRKTSFVSKASKQNLLKKLESISHYVIIQWSGASRLAAGVHMHPTDSLSFRNNSKNCLMRQELLVRSVAGHVLLDKQRRGADHGQAAILQLAQLHFIKLRGVSFQAKLDLQIQRIEAQIAGGVAFVEKGRGLDGAQSEENLPDCLRSLGVKFCNDAETKSTIKYCVGEMKSRLHRETKGSKHADTGVLKKRRTNNIIYKLYAST